MLNKIKKVMSKIRKGETKHSRSEILIFTMNSVKYIVLLASE